MTENNIYPVELLCTPAHIIITCTPSDYYYGLIPRKLATSCTMRDAPETAMLIHRAFQQILARDRIRIPELNDEPFTIAAMHTVCEVSVKLFVTEDGITSVLIERLDRCRYDNVQEKIANLFEAFHAEIKKYADTLRDHHCKGINSEDLIEPFLNK